MELKEIWYYITNKPYFDVMVISNGRKVKRFIELASGQENGEDFFLICKPLKAAWFKPETPIINGLKFMTFVDLNNAIPLIIKTDYVYDTTPYYIKEKKIETTSLDKDNVKNADGKPIEFAEITFPPSILFQKVEAHFIKLIMALPPNKWEELKWVFIAGFLVVGFIAWNIINSGGIRL
jgi:hypothetical protein